MSDPFNGTWKINNERSQHHTVDAPTHEVITFEIDGDLERYRVEYQVPGSPRMTLGYTTTYNDGNWVPYVLLAADGELSGVPGFGDVKVGDPVGMVTSLKVDERTRYRVARTVGGDAQYILQRRLADDGRSYDSTMLGIDGTIPLVRVFEKQ
jgi:hypothetical protein